MDMNAVVKPKTATMGAIIGISAAIDKSKYRLGEHAHADTGGQSYEHGDSYNGIDGALDSRLVFHRPRLREGGKRADAEGDGYHRDEVLEVHGGVICAVEIAHEALAV